MIAAGLLGANKAPEALSESGEVPHTISVVRTDSRTGRLVRRVVVTPKPGDDANAKLTLDPNVLAAIEETAKNFDVNPQLVQSVIQVESNYNPFAISNKGAQGLMQLMPATARRFGVTNTFDPRQNIEGGVRYLKFLQDTFQDDRLAIAAYNAGEKAVAKYGNVPPYPETINYVAKVGKKYGQAKQASAKTKIEAKVVEQPKPEEQEPRHIAAYVDAEGRLHIATR
jgi:transglycosylase-like protein with SLT domain